MLFACEFTNMNLQLGIKPFYELYNRLFSNKTYSNHAVKILRKQKILTCEIDLH